MLNNHHSCARPATTFPCGHACTLTSLMLKRAGTEPRDDAAEFGIYLVERARREQRECMLCQPGSGERARRRRDPRGGFKKSCARRHTEARR